MTRRFALSIGIVWLITSLVLLAISRPAIEAWRFPDPDDQLRLLQVRDWLAGQSWFDVTQYRLNMPQGVLMHWTRIVDLPIAGVIVAARPVLGEMGAEHLAVVLVPLLTMGTVLFLLAAIARRVMDEEKAVFATWIAPLCVLVTHQLRPMRIDHHGWQMACGLATVLALLDTNRRRGCMLAGAMVAVWLSISLEGLPMVAAILALVALRWVFDPAEAGGLRGAALTSAATTLGLFALMHPLADWGRPVCDAVSPLYLAMLVLAGSGIAIITRLPLHTRTARFGALALLGGGVLSVMPLMAPACLAGPFGQLDPLVYQTWYLHVAEGLPIWMQTPPVAVNVLLLPLIGIGGAALGVRMSSGEERFRWIAILYLTVTAALAAILVQRSGGFANLIAIPGAVRLIHPLLVKARTIRSLPVRVAATLGVLLMAAPGAVFSTAWALGDTDQQSAIATKATSVCSDSGAVKALAVLPKGNILAPLDISPAILVFTPHGAVASGHHRGAAAMRDVIVTFYGDEAQARAILLRRHIDYVAFCPGLPEIMTIENLAPSGFLARLDRGETPAWLSPVAIAGSPVKVWRVH